jgi:glycosyltransferase involved in cell wall biosynthesis
MSPEKGPDLAIEAALNAGLPLRLAGVVEDRHREFFEQTMRRARSSDVEYLGPLDRQELWHLLGDASALIMPLRWQEPFGLVVVESLAAGTPVIAWRMGAMPEILEDNVTGFLVDDVPAAVRSIRRIGEIDRASCRTVAEARFSDTAMARSYAGLYASLAR